MSLCGHPSLVDGLLVWRTEVTDVLDIERAEASIRVPAETLRQFERWHYLNDDIMVGEGLIRIRARNRTVTYRLQEGSFCSLCESWAAHRTADTPGAAGLPS